MRTSSTLSAIVLLAVASAAVAQTEPAAPTACPIHAQQNTRKGNRTAKAANNIKAAGTEPSKTDASKDAASKQGSEKKEGEAAKKEGEAKEGEKKEQAAEKENAAAAMTFSAAAICVIAFAGLALF